MKRYFAPGACSLSPHIVLREAGANFDLEQVNNQEKKTKSGVDYWTINPKGQVPVLVRQRRAAYGRPGDRPMDCRPKSFCRPDPAGRQVRALPRARVAQLRELRASQDLRADLPADHAGRLQGAF